MFLHLEHVFSPNVLDPKTIKQTYPKIEGDIIPCQKEKRLPYQIKKQSK